MAVALGFFADKISEDHDNWFTNLIQQKEYEEAFSKGTTSMDRARAVFDQHAPTLRAVSVWLIALGIMISYSMLEIGMIFPNERSSVLTHIHSHQCSSILYSVNQKYRVVLQRGTIFRNRNPEYRGIVEDP